MKIIYAILFSFIIAFSVKSQNVKNVKIIQEEKEIIIYYDLIHESGINNYSILAYYSLDNGKTYNLIKSVKGNYGANILAGKNKQIVWNILEDVEHDGIIGNIKIKVIANQKIITDRKVHLFGGFLGTYAKNELLFPYGYRFDFHPIRFNLKVGASYLGFYYSRRLNSNPDFKMESGGLSLLGINNQNNFMGILSIGGGIYTWKVTNEQTDTYGFFEMNYYFPLYKRAMFCLGFSTELNDYIAFNTGLTILIY